MAETVIKYKVLKTFSWGQASLYVKGMCIYVVNDFRAYNNKGTFLLNIDAEKLSEFKANLVEIKE